jgi:hypothetical protein
MKKLKGRLIRLMMVTWCASVDCSRNEQMTLHRPTNYRDGGERIIDVGILMLFFSRRIFDYCCCKWNGI